MKKICLFLLLFCTVKGAFSQGQLSIGSPGTAESFTDTKYDHSDGGTINVGTISNAANDPDCYIVKLNSTGGIVWQRRFTNASAGLAGYNEGFKKVIVCANGDYLAIGNYLDNGKIRGFVCRFNKATGAVIWSVTSGNFPALADVNGKGQVYTDVTETAAGNIAIAGAWDWVNGNAQGHSRGILVLLNSTGGEVWCRERNGTDVNNEYLTVNQLNNGNLLVTGVFDEDSRKATVILQVGEAAGNIVSTNTYTLSAPSTYINTVPVNNNMNSLWVYKTNIDASGNVAIGASAFTDWGSVGTAVNTIYAYNPVTLALTGSFYYHPNSNAARAFAFHPIAVNDYLISESVSTFGVQNTYFSRMQAGVRLYDRNITNASGNVGNVDIFSGNFNMAGTTPATINSGDAYILSSPVGFPITAQNGCGINEINTLTAVAHTPLRTNNASTFTNRNATRAINATPAATNSVVNIICGVPPNPCPVDTSYSLIKCSNQAVTLSARAGTTYSWSPATGLSAANVQNPVCTATTSTTYTVTITNTATNCTYNDVITVAVSTLAISTIPDTTICIGDTIRLAASGGTSYSWSPNYNISNTNIANPLVWPAVTTSYIVTISNRNGCSAMDTVVVNTRVCHCEDSCNWSLTGNTYVKPYNFIGSLNNADFKIRTNNTQRMVVSAAGDVGINTPAPTKTLDVNGEARVAVLPATTPNQSIVFADGSGNLKSLNASGNTNEYLSGNGTWQPVGPGGGGAVNADNGLTMQDPTTVALGDECGKGGGMFTNNRQINMNNQNLYFNTSKLGKVRIGNDQYKEILCKELDTRLELDTRGLDAYNDYISPNPSTSGLRFTELTARTEPIPNKFKGVLSLDEDGDVIWVQECCNRGGGVDLPTTDARIDAILDRLTKVEAELEKTKKQMAEMDVLLEKNNIIVLGQNTPNPFTDNTIISYSIPKTFGRAQLIFTATNGVVVKTADIKVSGKGQVNVFASDLSSGLYTYTLIIDGKVIETKKMIKL